MIKKAFNWTFGTFFRTLGRIIAFLVVGGAIALIMAKLGLFDFMVVHADTFKTINVYEFSKDEWCFSSSYNPTESCTIANHSNNFIYNTYNSTEVTSIFYFNSGWLWYGLDNSTQSIIIPILLQNTEDFEFITSQGSQYDIVDKSYFNYQVSAESNLGWTSCELLSSSNDVYYFKCPAVGYFKRLRLTAKFYQSNTNLLRPVPTLTFGVSELWTQSLNDNKTIQDALNVTRDNTNDTKQNTEDIKNSLNSDDVDDSSNAASGFFNDFTDNGHGLSGIVTAPLNAVNAMLTTTCTAPSATYKNKTFSLPCGDILWNQEGASNFKNILNVFYGGIICFGILKSLFKDVNDLKNPDNDKVEVVDL